MNAVLSEDNGRGVGRSQSQNSTRGNRPASRRRAACRRNSRTRGSVESYLSSCSILKLSVNVALVNKGRCWS